MLLHEEPPEADAVNHVTRLGTSLACNFLPFGADVTALCPKYLNIIRGQVGSRFTHNHWPPASIDSDLSTRFYA